MINISTRYEIDLTDSRWGIMADACEHDDKCGVPQKQKII
jgi:hypothetical protein